MSSSFEADPMYEIQINIVTLWCGILKLRLTTKGIVHHRAFLRWCLGTNFPCPCFSDQVYMLTGLPSIIQQGCDIRALSPCQAKARARQTVAAVFMVPSIVAILDILGLVWG